MSYPMEVRRVRRRRWEATVRLGPWGSMCVTGRSEADATHRASIVLDAYRIGVGVGEGRITADPNPAMEKRG